MDLYLCLSVRKQLTLVRRAQLEMVMIVIKSVVFRALMAGPQYVKMQALVLPQLAHVCHH